jgi:hypothetical protein
MREKPPSGRRKVLQVLAGGVGAGLAAPAGGAGAQQHAHAPSAAAPGAPAAPASFLDPHQLETLASLAEAIVPGSTAAGVAPFVDRLLAADTAARQRAFLGALGAIQAESAARYGKPWLGLTEAQRTELLTAAATARPASEARPWAPGQPVLPPPEPPAPPTLRDRFDLLKERIATAYYSSEAGMKELGWTGEMIHAEPPGCRHPGGHP